MLHASTSPLYLYTCPRCAHPFERRTRYLTHLKRRHNITLDPAELATAPYPFNRVSLRTQYRNEYQPHRHNQDRSSSGSSSGSSSPQRRGSTRQWQRYQRMLKLQNAARRKLSPCMVPSLSRHHHHFPPSPDGAGLAVFSLTDLAYDHDRPRSPGCETRGYRRGEWSSGKGWRRGSWEERYGRGFRLGGRDVWQIPGGERGVLAGAYWERRRRGC
jgi:hypothetical protein